MSMLPLRLLWNAMCGSPSSPDQVGSSSSAAGELVIRVVLPLTGFATRRSWLPAEPLEKTSGPRCPGNVACAESGPATNSSAAEHSALVPQNVQTDRLTSSPSVPDDDRATGWVALLAFAQT